MPHVAYAHRLPHGALGVKTSSGTMIIAFNKHVYTTNDPEIVKALNEHPQYGKNFKRIENAVEYKKVLSHASERDTRYVRGAATTVDPRHTPVVTDPVDSVISDEGPFKNTPTPISKKPAKRTAKKRSR